MAKTFLNEWICVYGVPRRIITDRGTNFVSTLFEDLAQFVGVDYVATTTAYRPQANGQNERSHRELHSYLAMYLEQGNKEVWDTLLRQAEWVHNSSHHEALQMSPYEVVTGKKPRDPLWLPERTDSYQQTSREVENHYEHYFGVKRDRLQEIRNRAKEAIAKAQAGYLERLNQDAKGQNYAVGDQVLLRSHGRSLVERKWSAKYNGPYTVTKAINASVYRISDPETGWTDIVHSSFLRPYNKQELGAPEGVQAVLEPEDETGTAAVQRMLSCPARVEESVNEDESEESDIESETSDSSRFETPVSSPKSADGGQNAGKPAFTLPSSIPEVLRSVKKMYTLLTGVPELD
jgi:hypothetical protein